jgi:WD40 repeat protein
MHQTVYSTYFPPESTSLKTFSSTPLYSALSRGPRCHLLSLLRGRELQLSRDVERACASALLPLAPVSRFAFPRGCVTALAFSPSGSLLAAAEKEGEVVVLSGEGWRPGSVQELAPLHRVDVSPHVRWIVSGLAWRDEATFLFSTLTPALHVVRVEDGGGGARSRVEVLPLRAPSAAPFGVFGFAVAPGATEASCATSDGRIVIVSLETGRVVESWVCHRLDINSLCYLAGRGEASDVIITGSDDGLLQLSDRRQARRVCGVLPGHQGGIASVAARGDGFSVCSNGKDQCVKVWDVRRALSHGAWAAAPAAARRASEGTWDYRWEAPPSGVFKRAHPLDASLLTLRGSAVIRTLIRAQWSPLCVDGGRHIAAGGADGVVCMWDVLAGMPAPCGAVLAAGIVREVKYHPTQPILVTGCYDSGEVVAHAPKACEHDLRFTEGGGSASQRAGLVQAKRLWALLATLKNQLLVARATEARDREREIIVQLEVANATASEIGRMHGVPSVVLDDLFLELDNEEFANSNEIDDVEEAEEEEEGEEEEEEEDGEVEEEGGEEDEDDE